MGLEGSLKVWRDLHEDGGILGSNGCLCDGRMLTGREGRMLLRRDVCGEELVLVGMEECLFGWRDAHEEGEMLFRMERCLHGGRDAWGDGGPDVRRT